MRSVAGVRVSTRAGYEGPIFHNHGAPTKGMQALSVHMKLGRQCKDHNRQPDCLAEILISDPPLQSLNQCPNFMFTYCV